MGWDLLTLPRTGIRAGERVAVAVSGGADSTALLLLVAAANALPKNALGVGLTAVHVNHGLRGAESDGDQEFVEALCERLGVVLHTVRVQTAEYAAENRQTIEEAARNMRYREFDALLGDGRADVVLTAHTLDDQAETVLMKLLRGAWLEGLGGISPVVTRVRGRVARPLLGVRRAALREYLAELGEGWREDSSNADEAYTRNRIRLGILPVLREENPGVDGTLANLAELAREEEARWEAELKRVLPQLILPGKPVRGGGRASSTGVGEQAVALELERLRPLDAALRRRVVRAAARQVGARLSFEETARVLRMAGFAPGGVVDPTVPAKVGGRLRLAGGLVVERSARELRMSREESVRLLGCGDSRIG